MRNWQRKKSHINKAGGSLFGAVFALGLVMPSAPIAATVSQSSAADMGLLQGCQTTGQTWNNAVENPTEVRATQGFAPCRPSTFGASNDPVVASVESYQFQRQILAETQRANSIGVIFELRNGFGDATGRYYQEMRISALDFAIYGVQGNDVSNSWSETVGRGMGDIGADDKTEITSVEVSVNNRSGLSLSFWSDRLFRAGGWRTAKIGAKR